MIHIERVSPANASTFIAVRLRCLQDSPTSFSSTYARESAFTDADWSQRIANWNGERGVGYVAAEDGVPCGLAGALLDAEDPAKAQLVSMWVAPGHRRAGVGNALVDAVQAWAQERGVRSLRLMVTSPNQSAIAFYMRLGFSMTDRTAPYPNDDALFEYEMTKAIG
jgi:ribosomal protein S18 acetylase RimI-like enzyme